MKKALLKDSFKEIKNTYKRFVSILLMAFLGVGFFSGIRAASPDMLDTIDQYYKEQNVYDIEIISTLGLTNSDLEAISKVENVEIVEGIYAKDGKIKTENKETIVKLLTLGELNKPVLLEGELPTKENECLVETSFLNLNNKKIGDTIELEIEDATNDNGDAIQYLKNNQLKIVGTVQSPIYISRDRGTSKLGAGKIEYYAYVPKENVNLEVYTNIYVKVKDAEQYITSKNKYEDYIEDVKENIEQIKEERENARKQGLVDIANQKVLDAESVLKTEKSNAEAKIRDAEKELADAKKEIANGQNEINANKKKVDKEFANAQKQIDNAKVQIQANEQTISAYPEGPEKQYALAEIRNAKIQLEQQEAELNKNKKLTNAQIEKVQKELKKAQVELQKGEKELEENKAEFNQKIAEAEKELSDAKEKIKDIENPKWYILDRNSNAGYVGYIQDTKSIENIGKVFPIVFFAVSALISLTSMTRMVEEQRMQIGILKALGYNQFQIISKYVLYASLASIIGGLAGMFVGFISLPPIVWELYKGTYQIADNIVLGFKWDIGGIGLILITVCIVGATLYAVIRELKETPAMLMRPKAPKAGNRVFLERITFIWKRLNFSQKVTLRNIFRYKKRFIMTIIGILGCTSLIVTGFGLKDSIEAILPNQYEKIFSYDLHINLKNENDLGHLNENEQLEKIVETYMTSVKAIKEDKEENVQVIVAKENLDGVINLIDSKTEEKLQLQENEIYLTDKVAQLINVKKGDTITLRNNDNEEYKVKISNIVENYVSHYIYMSKTTYEATIGKKYNTNVLLTKNIELTEDEEDELVKELVNQEEIAAVTRTSSLTKTLDDTLKLLNYVVVLLIVSAGLLAFVVLYNLANVNISERIRELATIKVLGFYDKEVYNYVARETTILTAIGIILGLLAGYLLNYFIIETCEINILRFARIIHPISYVYAIIITIIFTMIVNIATYFSLKKIDMIESLKSVE